jgi:DUF1009 family protein
MAGKLGIVAGGGDLPKKIIEACRATGRAFFVLALEGQAAPDAFDEFPHQWLRIGAVGKGVEILRNEAVEELILAGAVKRPSLAELKPDAFATRVLAKSVMRRGDDGLLRAVMEMLEKELDVTFVAPDDVLADLIAVSGQYGKFEPDDSAWRDIERGRDVVTALGRLDVGQSAVIQDGMVLGVEAVEGTDALLARCAKLSRGGIGGVLVKLAKPQQDKRADLPTLGVKTIQGAIDAGLRGIAVEAGGALILDRAAMIEAADAAGLFIVGLDPNPDVNERGGSDR